MAREVAESANKTKSVFLANMRHEIRTPLNAVIGFAQILQRDKTLSDKQSEQVSTILRSGEHLLSLINDILDLSKIEAGSATLKESGFSFHRLIEDLRLMFALRVEEKRLKLHVEIESGTPEFVSADEGKIRQILINLVGNALKFTEQGAITIHASAAQADPSESAGKDVYLTVQVIDTGMGIMDSEQELIFNAFEQSSSPRQKPGGTGLGLTISRRLAEILGGKLSVRSRHGEGSTFTLQIPVHAAAAVVEKKSDADFENVLRLLPGSGPVRILVADDVDENLRLMTDMLGPLGFEVRTASNGAEALAIFRTWKPSLVIMDLRMPVMNGFDATRAIRLESPGTEVPVIAVTASAFEDDKQVNEAGFSSYLRKPFTMSRLLGEMTRHLHLQYQQTTAPETQGVSIISAAGMPEELRTAVVDAVRAGNSVRMKELIKQVESLDAGLAELSMRLARDFNYDELLRLYEGGKHGN